MSLIKQGIVGALALSAILVSQPAAAADAKPKWLRVSVDDIKHNNDPIAPQYAFCVAAAQGHTAMGPNKNPRIGWSKGAAGTQSYAVIVHDTDVPSKFEDANKEGRTIARTLKRIDFTHMVLVDIPPTVREIPDGKESDKVTPKGKPPGKTEYGVRGVNDYSKFMAGDMAGAYRGYEAARPPRSGPIPHPYPFVRYFPHVPSLPLRGNFGANGARTTMTAGTPSGG